MTDVPPDRRPVNDGLVDDDELAEALAAQVAAYTSPIPVVAADAPAPEPVAAPDPAPDPVAAPEPAPESAPHPDPVEPAFEEPIVPPGMTTLEAIERLEAELRRRTGEHPAAPAEPASAPPGTMFPPPYRPFEQVPPAPEPTPAVEAVPPPLVEPPPLIEPPAFAPLAPPRPWVSPVSPESVEAPEPGAEAPVPPVEEPPVEAPPVGAPPVGAPPSGGAALAEPPVAEPAAEEPAAGAPAADAVDFRSFPPPVGIEPAPLPPYRPEAPLDLPPPTGPAVPLPEPPGAGLPSDGGDAAPSGSPPDDDVIDDIDRAFGPGAIPVDPDGAAVPAPPSEPIPTARLAPGEPGIVDRAAEHHPAFVVETAGLEPTALDLRAGRAARLFWLWFPASSSVLAMAVGAVLFSLGMSLRQAIVAALAGVALSFLALGLGTLAGKWSGQPTMVVSRATFGVVGNVVPALLAVLTRVFWAGALLWLLATSVGRILEDSGFDAGVGAAVWSLVGLGAGAAIVVVVAVFGYGFVARVQLVLAIVSAFLVVGTIALTADRVDLDAALTSGDGPWLLLLTGAVLVFSVLGLAWAQSSADVARYQRPAGVGGSSMLWSAFGATAPAFVLVAWGAVLAASDRDLADGLARAPLATIASLLPAWYPAPLLAAAGLGLLSGALLAVYSGGFAVQATGLRVRRPLATITASVLAFAVAAALLVLVDDVRGLVLEIATTLAVPVAAWAGIFGAEMMIRSRRFHAPSLLARGGVYPDVRWVNLVGLVAITAIGLGLTSAEPAWLSWQGYLLPFLGLDAEHPLAASDLGVLVALSLGLVLPVVSGIPSVRRQEDERS